MKQSDLLDAILQEIGNLDKSSGDTEKKASPTDSTIEQVKMGGASEKPRQRFRILVVEDNVVNQRLALRLLEKQGHSVRLAANGKEALAALEQEKFDLVLMDVQMPEMGGFEATSHVRTREQATGEHIPIIALTAHAMTGDRERCLEAGMDGYVSKPIQEKDLLRVFEGIRLQPTTGVAPNGGPSDTLAPNEIL